MERSHDAPRPRLLLLGLLLLLGGRLACGGSPKRIEDSAPPPPDSDAHDTSADDTCAGDDTGPVDTGEPAGIAGVHVPLAIDPDVSIQDNHWPMSRSPGPPRTSWVSTTSMPPGGGSGSVATAGRQTDGADPDQDDDPVAGP
ncbi:MAG: hypothetical protein ABIO70_26205 [Pseudomonadota bacterium]